MESTQDPEATSGAPPSPVEEGVPARAADPQLLNNRLVRVSIIGSFLILLFGSIFFARDFLLPVTIAVLLSLTLSPVVRFLERRRIPPVLTALALVVALVLSIGSGAYLMSGPVADWVAKAPEIGRQLEQKLRRLRAPVDAMVEVTEQVDEVTDSASSPDVQKVVIQQPGILTQAASSVGGMMTTLGVTLVLLLFLLASGDMFYEKTVRAIPTFSDKKRAVRILKDVEREVSNYLFTVTLINIGLGFAIAAVMFALGMPNFYLWGAAAALLNFIPYVGALIGIVGVGLVALVSFDSIAYAALAPLAYMICTIIEGQFLAPLILGRRLELNAVAIFIAVAMWTWLWGIVGALIAVPLLVMVKVVCDHFDHLQSVGEFLSERRAPAAADE